MRTTVRPPSLSLTALCHERTISFYATVSCAREMPVHPDVDSSSSSCAVCRAPSGSEKKSTSFVAHRSAASVLLLLERASALDRELSTGSLFLLSATNDKEGGCRHHYRWQVWKHARHATPTCEVGKNCEIWRMQHVDFYSPVICFR